MVAMSDIPKVNALFAEQQTINQAMRLTDPKIVQFVLTSGGDDDSGNLVNVSAADVPYPSQMIDSIKSLLAARQNTITQELSQLGVTVAQAAKAKKG